MSWCKGHSWENMQGKKCERCGCLWDRHEACCKGQCGVHPRGSKNECEKFTEDGFVEELLKIRKRNDKK